MEITLYHWLVLSAVLFSIGAYGTLARRNPIACIMSLELVLNAASINFAAANHYISPENVAGQIFAIFIIAVAAAETAVGVAIAIRLYRLCGKIDLLSAVELKG